MTGLAVGLLVVGLQAPSSSPTPDAVAVDRGVEFLSRAVPEWPRENGCYSCHNNGDAARALFAFIEGGGSVPASSIEGTLSWLAAPEGWGDQKGEEAFSDVVLTRVQFASALLGALEAGLVEQRPALVEAAELVASDQHSDGSWRLDASEAMGSPATYGRILATASARRVLARADGDRFREAILRADDFLRGLDIANVLTAAAVLDGLAETGGEAAARQRSRAIEVIASGQAPSGGWGPYVSSRPEPFDTALVLLALWRAGERPDLIASGRGYLLDRQLEDGSWVETTRPAGQTSYAQYISTTGWALLALVRTGALTAAPQ